MKRAVIVVRAPGVGKFGMAFGNGLRRHGWTVDIKRDPAPADLLVMWGVRRKGAIEQQRKRGEVVILERGYIGDRKIWTSVSFGGALNGRAEFRGVSDDPARFEKHFEHLMQPWRAVDDTALLIGQVPGDAALAPVGGMLDGWYRSVAESLSLMGHVVLFRPHPRAIERGLHIPKIPHATRSWGDLETDLRQCGRCVTFNSNTAVEAVLAGVPTVACDPGSMAWDVTSHDPIGDPVRPDRSRWAARLAWKQWTLEEMQSGECWARVGREKIAA